MRAQRSLHIEEKLGKLAALLGDTVEEQSVDANGGRQGGDVLLNGPAMPCEGVVQDDIDAMFA